jgi:hypothetical protein
MKKILIGLVVLALVFFVFSGKGPVSCRNEPMNRGEYIESFCKFVERTQRECGSYTAEDWARLVETYRLYSGPLYERFGPELSTVEHLKFRKYQAHFNLLYQEFQTKEVLKRGKGVIDEARANRAVRNFKNRLLNLFPKGGTPNE